MLTILSFLILGIGIGFIGRRWAAVLALADKVTNGAVYLLLFLLGVSVGLNKTVMSGLVNLGLQALLLSSGAVLGSVLASMLVYNYFFRPAETYEK
jgi:uncharacterized membrane protein YbjE (DUF340 family)